jgi:hypothetical protein
MGRRPSTGGCKPVPSYVLTPACLSILNWFGRLQTSNDVSPHRLQRGLCDRVLLPSPTGPTSPSSAARWDAGCRLPTQTADGRARCFCGAEITFADMDQHIYAAHMDQSKGPHPGYRRGP